MTDGTLLQPLNLTNLVLQNSYIVIMALGMLLIIVTGHIDLSVGSVAGFVGAVAAVLMVRYHVAYPLAFLACLLVGALLGASHGIDVEPFGFFVAKSAVLFAVIVFFAGLIASHRGLPNVLVIMTALIGLYGFVTTRTVIGRHIYAIGGNARAASLSGIKTERL